MCVIISVVLVCLDMIEPLFVLGYEPRGVILDDLLL